MNSPLLWTFIGIGFGIGLAFILVSFVGKESKEERIEQDDVLEQNLEKAVDNASKTIKDLNELSEYIMTQLEEKHQELVFLYDLIDKKAKEQTTSNYNQLILEDNKNDKVYEIEQKTTLQSVINLYEEGYTINQIAKEKDMGVEEVRLMIEFNKKRKKV